MARNMGFIWDGMDFEWASWVLHGIEWDDMLLEWDFFRVYDGDFSHGKVICKLGEISWGVMKSMLMIKQVQLYVPSGYD